MLFLQDLVKYTDGTKYWKSVDVSREVGPCELAVITAYV